MVVSDGRQRCDWPGEDDPLMLAYHDEDWGVPVHEDRLHFELLILEGAQAGLSWRSVLVRRESYRLAFAGFDPAQVAAFGPADQARLLQDRGIIRNRKKVESAVRNAAAFLAVQAEHGSSAACLSCRPRPGSRARSARICERAASASSGRRSATRTCSRPGWSTTTS